MGDSSFYNLSFKTLDGKEYSFSALKGKKVLIVNLASYCGYTYQYEELQTLSEKYKETLVVLGFPSNSFFQEPFGDSTIQKTCTKYEVTFPIFEKSAVKGRKINSVYKWLTHKSLNGWNEEVPSWNFNKYLIDENGKLIKLLGSKVSPLSPEVIDWVEGK